MKFPRREFLIATIISAAGFYLSTRKKLDTSKDVRITSGLEEDIYEYYNEHKKEVDFWINDVFLLDDEMAFFLNIKTWKKVPYKGEILVPNSDKVREKARRYFSRSFREKLRYVRGKYSKIKNCIESWPMYNDWLRGAFKSSKRQHFAHVEVPLQFIRLPLAESLLNPRAISWAGALGLWQFLRDTGQRYGLNLEKKHFEDDSFDILKSTEAAYAHFSDLLNLLPDWRLVLSCYILGERKMFTDLEEALKQAGKFPNHESLKDKPPYDTYFEETLWRAKIERGLKPQSFFDYYGIEDRNFDEIYEIFKEFEANKPRFSTSQYVNRFVAYDLVVNHPTEFGFHNLNYKSPIEFEEVAIDGGLSLDALAEYLYVDPEILSALNSRYTHNITPISSQGEKFTLRVPKDMTNWLLLTFMSDEDKARTRVNSIEYTVRPGDTIYKIAEQLDMDYKNILLEPGRSIDKIFAGEKLPVVFR